jgi:hypothetical protein
MTPAPIPTQRPFRVAAVRAALAAALALVLFLAFSHEAVQLSPQGNQFIRSAYGLRTQGELDLLNDRPLSFFPPLYAFLLAGLGALGLAPVPAIVLINAAVLAAGIWAFRELAGRMGIRSARAATALYAVLAANVYWFRMARPDAIVALLAMAAALALAAHAADGRRRFLVLAALAAGAAALTRYMGLFTVVPMAVNGILLAPGRAGKRGRDLALFVPLALAPIAAWLLRTWARTGYATGMSRTAFREDAARTGLLDNVVALAHTAGLDLFGARAMGVRLLVHEGGAQPHPAVTMGIAGVGLALVAVAAVAVVAAGRSRAAGPAETPDPFAGHARRLVASFTAIHAGALLVLWTAGNNDPIHTRFVAPLYPGLVLLLFAWGEGLARRGIRVAAAALAALAVLVGAVNLDKSVLLLGDSPPETLIKKTLHRPEDLWVRTLEWNRPVFLVPERGRRESDEAD